MARALPCAVVHERAGQSVKQNGGQSNPKLPLTTPLTTPLANLTSNWIYKLVEQSHQLRCLLAVGTLFSARKSCHEFYSAGVGKGESAAGGNTLMSLSGIAGVPLPASPRASSVAANHVGGKR